MFAKIDKNTGAFMTYAAFQSSQKAYLERVTPQGNKDSIPHIPELYYGDDFTVKLLDSDGIQERLDLARAEAEAAGKPFDETRLKGELIARTAGDLSKEAKLEYDKYIPAKDPEALYAGLSGFYAQLTGGDLAKDTRSEAGEKDILKVLGRENLNGVSDIERAAALTSIVKSRILPAYQDLRNTNTVAAYHIIMVENKAANPLGFYKSRLEKLHEETKQKLEPFADKLLPVTHDGGAWHEMTHALGTDDESKCEGFRFLKTLKEYQEPVLILPDINARLYNNMSTLEKIRKDARAGKKTLEGNFRYIMPKMLRHIVENADALAKETRGMTDAQLMEKNKEIVAKYSYSNETEEAFRSLAKECDSPGALAQMMQEVYKNGADHPKTGAVFELADDFIRTAQVLNPSLPPDRLAETFFAEENFASQSRNEGKEKIESKQSVELSPEEKKRCADVYREVRRVNPSLTGQELTQAFAKAVVKDAWAQKAALEAEAEDPKRARDILFNEQECRSRTQAVNACLMRSRNAAVVARTYGAEFEKAMSKPSLHSALMNEQRKEDALKTAAFTKAVSKSR